MTLQQAALARFGGEAEVQHQIALLNRRLAYHRGVAFHREFPCPGVAWNPIDYVREFERKNHLRSQA